MVGKLDEGAADVGGTEVVVGLVDEGGATEDVEATDDVGLTGDTTTDELVGFVEDGTADEVEALTDDDATVEALTEELALPAPAAEQPTRVLLIATSSYQKVSVLPAYDSQPK